MTQGKRYKKNSLAHVARPLGIYSEARETDGEQNAFCHRAEKILSAYRECSVERQKVPKTWEQL
ncbi:hypothetical protein HQ34_06365 [Porphyromonas cangingivalis]|nr:hypothetical protein HQ34_06365 [Porphyromonas cangingivalis]